MARFRIRTNWTNSVSLTHEFALEDLADAGTRDKLKWAMADPERLRPGESRQAVTERAGATFAELAQSLRERGHKPQAVAHFVNRLVFCMFAEDVGLLPDNMFTRMLEHARKRPEEFTELSRDLFGAMSTGGRIGFEAVGWFNGGLFDDDETLPLDRTEIDVTLKAAALDWSEIDPSIFGTLFERGLDPDKRSQLGAHYTDREKIMLIVEPVIVQSRYSRNGRRRRSRSRPRSNARARRSLRRHEHGCASRQSARCAASSNGCASSSCSIQPAGPGTSCTSHCTHSRTSSTACSWRPRRWVFNAASRPSDPRT